MSRPDARMRFVDALRALASQVIVWHHFSSNGPLADAAAEAAPGAMGWLYDYGRMAVQVFFVVAGLVAARGLSRYRPDGVRSFGAYVWKRWKRLAPPYLAILAIAMVANEVARAWMTDPSISARPTLLQLLAHVFFLQDLLGYEALTTGIWYVAIDFQLTLLTLVVVGLSGKRSAVAQAAFAALAAMSLLWLNRNGELDVWAVYFFGSFFVGMALEWTLSGAGPRWSFWACAALVVVALAVDWRPRLAVALATGLAIWGAARLGLLHRWPASPVVAFLGRISYSLFLIHFPVWLVVSGFMVRNGPCSGPVALAAMAGAWVASMAAAVAFHFAVEARFSAARAEASAPGALGTDAR